MTRQIHMTGLALLTIALVGMGQVSAQSKTLVRSTRQVESTSLPGDHVAWFSNSNPNVTIELSMLSENANPKSLFGTKVSVIDPNGKTREFTANEWGNVTVDHAVEGLYAVVATNLHSHGATLFQFKKSSDDTTENVQLALLDVSSERLLPLIQGFKQLSRSAASVTTKIETGASFKHQINLGPKGELLGQVVLMNDQTRSLADCTIVLFKNGRPVARHTTDEQGRFSMTGVRPGVHGVIAVGPAGYAAFAFNAVDSTPLSNHSVKNSIQLIGARIQSPQALPVVMVPGPQAALTIKSVQQFYSSNGVGSGNPGTLNASAGQPFTGTSLGTSLNGGAAGGFGGASAGGVGAGGSFGGLGALGAVGAAASSSNSNNNSPGLVVSPSTSNP
jgi:hypothetical protein